MRNITRLIVLGLLGLFLLGCSSDDDSGDSEQNTIVDNSVTLNGCAESMATDLRGQASVTITNLSVWGIGHNACILVSAGTSVTWEGDFNSHPLVGGTPGQVDATSPITITSPMSGTQPITVNFPSSGDFGYYCTTHTSSMQGAIFVE